MKYCFGCGKLTPGDPAYCQFCGKTYDVKLCSRGHQNPRNAEVCSQCGSRELSKPQPKIPMSWRLLALLIQLGLGVLLAYVSLSILIALLKTPAFQELIVLTSLLLGGLWWCFSKLPEWLQDAIRTVWKWKNHDD